MTIGKDYDVVGYDPETGIFRIYDDNEDLTYVQLSIPLYPNTLVEVFRDVTTEYRNEIIDNILL